VAVVLQVLMEAKQKLGSTVRQKVADAIAARKHEDVMRFTRLFRPLRMQVCIIPETQAFSVHGDDCLGALPFVRLGTTYLAQHRTRACSSFNSTCASWLRSGLGNTTTSLWRAVST
jgi:hypothetical protein